VTANIGSQLSPPFLTESGVRQGCVLAPSRFCRAVDWVLQESLQHSGLMVSDEQFSDIDIVVMDGDQTGLTDTLDCMESACSALGLHISWKKTKIQNIGAGACPADVVVGGSDDSDGGGSTRLHVPWKPDIVDNRITHRAATENQERIR